MANIRAEIQPSVRPFVKPGEALGWVERLKERGLWPPRLHDRKDNKNDDHKTTTPFLVIPTTPADSGLRPQPNSLAFHSKGVWIEDIGGTVVTTPSVGGQYRIKCRIRNMGAFPAYGGMADFFVNKPSVFIAAAGTSATLPALGHTGFSLLQGQETVIACPNLWQPATADELAFSVVVHVYDPFTDQISSRFDARNDRHVGRHDLTPDLYVRDWTDSDGVHDTGLEPSVRNVFYHTSDVWNRRSAAPGPFINDQPQNQNPQAGNGAAGDNFIFARISRNDASVEQEVKAHFLFAEFGTGSPFIDCSAAPDPSITLLPGETSKIISIPWHLHPSSSTHLCIAVQVYSEDDPYMPPGLLGYTPGWPTTDLMVINDNNKAQRNIAVWDGVPKTAGMHFGIIFNAATFVRDVVLTLEASEGALQKLKNARISVPSFNLVQEFLPGSSLVLKNMLPGERRWIAFSYDGFSVGAEETLSLYFNEVVGENIVNGFAFDLRGATANNLVLPTISFQSAVFYRMMEGMGIGLAEKGLALCQQLPETNAPARAYLNALPELSDIMAASLNEIWSKYKGSIDNLGSMENLKQLRGANQQQLATVIALHNKVLHQTDALQTIAIKSKGDLADILFTVRLQRDVYKTEPLASSQRFWDLLKVTEQFIQDYPHEQGAVKLYAPFVKALMGDFETTAALLDNGVIKARFIELGKSLENTPEEVQKAHLNFLNAIVLLFAKMETRQAGDQLPGRGVNP